MKGKLLLDCGEGKALGIVATVCLLPATELLDAELAEREAFQDGSGRELKRLLIASMSQTGGSTLEEVLPTVVMNAGDSINSEYLRDLFDQVGEKAGG